MAGNILTALSSGVNLANSLMNEQIKINNELTEADYKSQSYEFNDAFKSMMMDFENRPDYENFQQEYDDFFEQWKNTVNTNAKTGASAIALSDMVDNTYQQYKFGLQQSVLNSQRNAVMTLHNEEIERTKQDTLISTEDKVSNILDINNQDYSSGNFASAQAYEQKTLSDITDVILYDSKDIGLNILAAGGSLEDAINAAYTGADKDLKITMLQAGTLVDEDRSGSLNRDGIKSQLRKELTTYYNTVVTEKQNQNEQKLSQQYTKLLQLSGNDLLTGINNAFSMLNGMTGNTLKANVRDEYATKFKRLFDALEDPETSTSQGNNKVKVALYESLLTNPDAVAMALKNGDFEDMNCAKEAVMRQDKAMYEEAIGRTLTDKEYMYERASEINDFMSNLIKTGALPVKATEIVNDVKTFLNTFISRSTGMNAEKWAENNKLHYIDVLNDVNLMALDLLYECNLADPSEIEGLIGKFENRVGAKYLGLLDFDMNRKFGESEDKVYSRLVNNLSNEASAMTYGDSDAITFAAGAKDASEKVAAYTQKKMTEIGINPVKWEYTKTEHDVDALPIVTGSDGNKYRLISNNGQTELQRKTTAKDWETVVEPVATNRKALKKAYSEKMKQQDKEDSAIIDQLLNAEIIPDGYTEEEWWTKITDGEKRTILEQIAQTDAAKWERLKAKIK